MPDARPSDALAGRSALSAEIISGDLVAVENNKVGAKRGVKAGPR